jgi:hypothetical protein
MMLDDVITKNKKGLLLNKFALKHICHKSLQPPIWDKTGTISLNVFTFKFSSKTLM